MPRMNLTAQIAKLKAQQADNSASFDAATERLKKLREERKNLQTEIAELERKARNHRLIEIGALVEKILGESVDRGILAGLLDREKNLFDGSGNAYEIKLAGDSLISRWEAERQAAKAARGRKAGQNTGADNISSEEAELTDNGNGNGI